MHIALKPYAYKKTSGGQTCKSSSYVNCPMTYGNLSTADCPPPNYGWDSPAPCLILKVNKVKKVILLLHTTLMLCYTEQEKRKNILTIAYILYIKLSTTKLPELERVFFNFFIKACDLHWHKTVSYI